MPPAMHPRSGFTTSIFGTTLALSFLIVGLPHLIPCPVDSKQYAEGVMEITDEDGIRRQVRRIPRRRPIESDDVGPLQVFRDGGSEDKLERRDTRECPVPKPSGIFGQILGFKQEDNRRPVVRIEPTKLEDRGSQKNGR